MKDMLSRGNSPRISLKPARSIVEKWKNTLRNPLRKWWIRSYLDWLGADRLAVMGYDLDTLLSDLGDVPLAGSYMMSDQSE